MSDFLTRCRKAGFSFFNTGTKQKKVLTSWTQYQTRKPTDLEFKSWLKSPIQNWAIVCGKISNLLVIDVDPRNGGDATPFQNRGIFEMKTPSGGSHFYFTYDPLLKKTKGRPSGFLKGIDIQTDASLVFCPPSDFGKGTYTLVHDTHIAPMPDDLMVRIIEALVPEKEAEEYRPYTQSKNPEMGRPGDIFNALATWEDVLLPLGWARVGGNHGGVQYWRRPGKTDGISASTNWKNYDLLFSYSTTVSELNHKKGYTKFTALTALKFNGDYREAAKSLVMENYKIANNLIK